MQIRFFKNNSSPETLTKQLSNPVTLNGSVKGELNIIEPAILVDTDISEYNYMYIPDFGRSYFINGCEIIRTGHYLIRNPHVDVLGSFASYIKANRVIIDKTESSSLKNEYINDGSYVITDKTIQDKAEFPTGFSATDYQYVLLTAGGSVSNNAYSDSGTGGGHGY